MARKMKIPTWAYAVVAVVVLGVLVSMVASPAMDMTCPGSYIYCPGVGCVSGKDKCFPGAKGGPTKVFSHETFDVPKPKAWQEGWEKTIPQMFGKWPGSGVKSVPPDYGKETFVSKTCPGGYRSDGPCLMDF
jgi:hypothetical protein